MVECYRLYKELEEPKNASDILYKFSNYLLSLASHLSSAVAKHVTISKRHRKQQATKVDNIESCCKQSNCQHEGGGGGKRSYNSEESIRKERRQHNVSMPHTPTLAATSTHPRPKNVLIKGTCARTHTLNMKKKFKGNRRAAHPSTNTSLKMHTKLAIK